MTDRAQPVMSLTRAQADAMQAREAALRAALAKVMMGLADRLREGLDEGKNIRPYEREALVQAEAAMSMKAED